MLVIVVLLATDVPIHVATGVVVRVLGILDEFYNKYYTWVGRVYLCLEHHVCANPLDGRYTSDNHTH